MAIKRLRESKGLTQAELARRCGYPGADPQSRISHYERGYRQPSVQELQQIAIALGIEASELLDGASPGGAGSDKTSVLDPEIVEHLSKINEDQRAAILAVLRAFAVARVEAT